MKQGYKDLIVWQKSMDLVIAVYELTKDLPLMKNMGLNLRQIDVQSQSLQILPRGVVAEVKKNLIIF